MKEIFPARESLLIKAVEKGLNIWIKHKCNKVRSLNIKIDVLNGSLLKGNISKIYLIGNQIDFQGLPVDFIELETGPIKINIKSILNLRIIDVFEIKGSINLKGELLKDALLSKRWKSLRDWISYKLLCKNYLTEFKIENDRIEIHAKNHKTDLINICFFELSHKEGNIVINSLDNKISELMPMDESIKISKAFIKEGLIILDGKSTVNP